MSVGGCNKRTADCTVTMDVDQTDSHRSEPNSLNYLNDEQSSN